jgi:hypothetical protein
MYSFTFEKQKSGFPVAITTNNDILYLTEYKNLTKKVSRRYKKQINIDDYDHLFENVKSRKNVIKGYVEKLLVDPEASNYVTNTQALQIYKIIKNEQLRLGQPTTEISLNDDETFRIYPNPDENQFECLFICGQSGSGKSTVALQYSLLYHSIFPDNDIYLISSLDKDVTLDKNKNIIRIDIDSFLKDPPNIQEFENSLVIFDDYETLEHTDIKLYKSITALMTQLISKGRHNKTRTIVIRHKFQNSGDKVGQLLVSEATKYIVYPKTCSQANLKLLFGTHGAMNNKQITDLYKLPSRWVCYNKGFPNYVISENEAFLIHK